MANTLPVPAPRFTRGLALIVAVFLVTVSAQLAIIVLATRTLSAARAYVAGEGRWSKAQLQAVQARHRYADTGNPAGYAAFEQALEVTLGDRRARVTLDGPRPDHDVARQVFSSAAITRTTSPG